MVSARPASSRRGSQRFAANNPGTAIRFLSASQEPDAVSLEALGTGHKVLVVDDAHDRDGLKLLIEYAVDLRHKTRLLIATRPYAEQRIRNELALYGIVDPSLVRLERLEKQALHALVVEVLEEFGGVPEWAGAILAIAADSPLVAAMAARVVARDGIIPELARGERELRQIILSRFTRVITGHLGTSADAALLRAVLELLAIIQPFHIDDRRVAELMEATRPGIVAADVSRALKMLVDGGVIYKRGQLYRLMPDLLGDFLIEESCIGADGRLTTFALAVADAVEGDRLTQVWSILAAWTGAGWKATRHRAIFLSRYGASYAPSKTNMICASKRSWRWRIISRAKRLNSCRRRSNRTWY